MTKEIRWDEGLCNCGALRQASRYVSAAYDQVLTASGLRTTQFGILYALAARSAQTITELSAIMAMDRTTLGRNLKLLEQDGLLRYRPGPDRRERLVELTAKGRKKLEAAYPLWQEAQEQFESRFGAARANELRNTLRSVLRTGLDPWGHERMLADGQ
jgi:DNA-binding MarR family transcriptional regulator